MPTLAGWLTGEQVAQEIIERTVTAMGEALAQSGGYNGRPALALQPGAGLTALSDIAYTMQRNDEPPLLDWVPARRTMVYRRPLAGAHTLYYREDWPAKGNLLFASEIKALFAVGVPRALHLPALDALLRYGFIPAPWTAFKDIYVVPAGSLLRWQHAKTVMNHHIDYDDKPLSYSQALQSLQEHFEDIIRGQLPPHDQLIALTSGSIASQIALLAAAQYTHQKFPITAYDYKQGNSQQVWKAIEHTVQYHQQQLIAISGVDQLEFWTATLSQLEAPTTSTRILAWHQLLHTVAEQTGARVAISGLGANLLLNPELRADTTSGDILQWYAQAIRQQPNQTSPALWSHDTQQILQKAERWEDTLHARKLIRKVAQFKDKRQGLRYLDLHVRLPDAIVSTAQQIATQERIALRSPYLHHDLLTTLARLPVTSETKPSAEDFLQPLIQKYMPQARQGKQQATPPFPLLAPANSLLHMEDNEVLQQVLSPEALKKTGLFDIQAVQELQKQTEVTRELIFVFTTQLLSQLFDV